MGTILCTTSSFETSSSHVLELLNNNGLQTVINSSGRKLTAEEMKDLLDRYRPVGLLIGTELITRSALELARDYSNVISRVGVGWENIDRL